MVVVFFAGMAAGAINTLVGSGTLITFPTLLALGVPPVTANVSNNIGLVPGSASGAWGYRAELVGQGGLVRRLAPASLIGGLVGALLLLVLPSKAFSAIVPLLIAIGVILVIIGPTLNRRIAARNAGLPPRAHGAPWVLPAVGIAGVYGGYFGAAQGVILMGIFGIGLDDKVQRNNAVKNVLSALVNAIAAVLFIIVADVDWLIVALIAVGSAIGGQIGAGIGRKLPAIWLRSLIVVVGCTAITVLLFR